MAAVDVPTLWCENILLLNDGFWSNLTSMLLLQLDLFWTGVGRLMLLGAPRQTCGESVHVRGPKLLGPDLLRASACAGVEVGRPLHLCKQPDEAMAT